MTIWDFALTHPVAFGVCVFFVAGGVENVVTTALLLVAAWRLRK
jgi:hypothetical protein